MSIHALNYLELHNQLFIKILKTGSGLNLGLKINPKDKNVRCFIDFERNCAWVEHKGQVAYIPTSNIASADLADPSVAGLPEPEAEAHLPPAIARARRAMEAPTPTHVGTEPTPTVPMPDFDPNDEEAAARHRELVRQASATANRPVPTAQNDLLIQEARMAAAGIKGHGAQVQTPTQPKEGMSVAGKPKAISHSQLRAQIAKESKE